MNISQSRAHVTVSFGLSGSVTLFLALWTYGDGQTDGVQCVTWPRNNLDRSTLSISL